uniref:Uncharacterized protein n=1 Tax=Cacopsylla melanoneura TaxID=428564 RepID=A0A8D8YUX4_9HEMI
MLPRKREVMHQSVSMKKGCKGEKFPPFVKPFILSQQGQKDSFKGVYCKLTSTHRSKFRRKTHTIIFIAYLFYFYNFSSPLFRLIGTSFFHTQRHKTHKVHVVSQITKIPLFKGIKYLVTYDETR